MSDDTRPGTSVLMTRALDVLRERPGLAEVVSSLMLDMHAALAAERDRADGLAAIVERARQHVASMSDDDEYPLEAMWRSEIMQRLTTAPSDALAAHDAEVWDACLDAIDENELNTQQAREGNPYRTTS